MVETSEVERKVCPVYLRQCSRVEHLIERTGVNTSRGERGNVMTREKMRILPREEEVGIQGYGGEERLWLAGAKTGAPGESPCHAASLMHPVSPCTEIGQSAQLSCSVYGW